MVTFFDFCAGFRYISVGKEPPKPRRRPAIVGYRNFSPDLEPESFYYSKLLLHVTWKEPGDWLREADDGSHAAAFQRIAQDTVNYPTFLQSICMPELDGTVEAARKLQAVQANMYMKANWLRISSGTVGRTAEPTRATTGTPYTSWRVSRNGTAPTSTSWCRTPCPQGPPPASLRPTDPTPETTRQRQAMEYIIRAVLDQPHTKDSASLQRLRILLHGPGGCGKSVVVRAAARMLRQSGKGAVIAAPTGVAAWNINGVTLHQCCFLPVVNKSHGKACDAPLPRTPQLAALQDLWARISVLFVDEISFISAFMLDRLDHVPFGGLHLVFSGDLYQLPPPGGLPSFASSLWRLFEVCELEGNQRAARDPEWAALLARVRVGKWTDADLRTLSSLVIKRNSGKKPAAGAVHLHATRKAVAEDSQRYIKEHLESSGAQLHDCPAVDINVKTGAPLLPDAVWAEPANTGGLETFLQVAVGARVMLRHNIDVQDGLVNGACGTVEHVQAQDEGGEVEKIWVKFDTQAGARWCAANETSCVAIARKAAAFQDKDDRKAERKQFPLVLCKTTTIHKSQAATYHDGAHCRLDSTVTQEGQAYVALSRCPTRAHCTLERFNPSCLKWNANAEWALTQLRAQQADRSGSLL